MLPSATHSAVDRESVKGRVGGRTHEISRLIGRSLRAVRRPAALGENTIAVDCDVLQADGGTRTAAITGAYVALADAVTYLREHGRAGTTRSRCPARSRPCRSAWSTAGSGWTCRTRRTSRAEVDMNVVATDVGTLVEVQGTAEGATFARTTLDAMLDSALAGIERLTVLQRAALAEPLTRYRSREAPRRRDDVSAPDGGYCWPAATSRSSLSCAGSSARMSRSSAWPTSPPYDEEPETGATFEDNAAAKAQQAAPRPARSAWPTTPGSRSTR